MNWKTLVNNLQFTCTEMCLFLQLNIQPIEIHISCKKGNTVKLFSPFDLHVGEIEWTIYKFKIPFRKLKKNKNPLIIHSLNYGLPKI